MRAATATIAATAFAFRQNAVAPASFADAFVDVHSAGDPSAERKLTSIRPGGPWLHPPSWRGSGGIFQETGCRSVTLCMVSFASRSSSSRPPVPETNDPYALLGLDSRTFPSPKDIKRAYKKMASKYHPDRIVNRDSTAEEKRRANDDFARITAAYETLKRGDEVSVEAPVAPPPPSNWWERASSAPSTSDYGGGAQPQASYNNNDWWGQSVAPPPSPSPNRAESGQQPPSANNWWGQSVTPPSPSPNRTERQQPSPNNNWWGQSVAPPPPPSPKSHRTENQSANNNWWGQSVDSSPPPSPSDHQREWKPSHRSDSWAFDPPSPSPGARRGESHGASTTVNGDWQGNGHQHSDKAEWEKRIENEKKKRKAEVSKIQSDFDKQRRELETTVSNLRSSLNEANQRAATLTSKQAELEQSLENAYRIHSTQMSDLKAKAEAEQKQRGRGAKAESRSAFEKERKKLEKEVTTLRSSLEEANSRVSWLTSKRSELERSLKNAEKKYAAHKSEAGRAKRVEEARAVSQATFEEERRKFETEVSTLRASLEEANRHVSTLTSKQAELQRKLDNTNRKYAAQMSDVKARETKRARRAEYAQGTFEEERRKFETEISSLRSSLEEANRNVSTLTSKQAELQRKLENTNRKHAAQMSDVKSRVTKRAQQAEDAQATSQSASREAQAKLERKVINLQGSLDEANRRVIALTSQRKELERSLEHANGMHAAQMSELKANVKVEQTQMLDSLRLNGNVDLDDAKQKMANIESDLTRRLLEARIEGNKTRDRLEKERHRMVSQRDSIIESYESERTSLRKLVRLSLTLVRNRIFGVFLGMFRKLCFWRRKNSSQLRKTDQLDFLRYESG